MGIITRSSGGVSWSPVREANDLITDGSTTSLVWRQLLSIINKGLSLGGFLLLEDFELGTELLKICDKNMGPTLYTSLLDDRCSNV